MKKKRPALILQNECNVVDAEAEEAEKTRSAT